MIKNEQEDDDDSLFSVVTGSGIGPARKRAINSLEKAATAEAIGRGQKGRIFCKCEKGCASNRCRCLFNKYIEILKNISVY